MAQGEIQSRWAAVRDHARHFSNYTFVYPVISRRSNGLSVGVNLNPDKVCNFDCIYCEVDRRIPGVVSGVNLRQMGDELSDMVRFVKGGGLAKEPRFDEVPWLTQEVKDIAFSGDGEPTMINNFAECVETVVEIQQKEGLDKTKIVLITDAAGLNKTEIKRGLEIMDAHNGEIWGKLDAGTEAYYKTVNRSNVKFGRILTNLMETSLERPIVIQSLFLKVSGKAMSDEELTAYCGRLNAIKADGGKIREVHLYTIARPTQEGFATKLEPTRLKAIGEKVQDSTGLEVKIFP